MQGRWSGATRTRLTAAGWFEGRRVDTAAYREPLEQVGFTAFTEALGFLGEFGGLSVAQQARQAGAAEDRLRFDPVAALAWIDPLWVHGIYAPLLERDLYPLGLADARMELLLVDRRGELYGGLDRQLYHYGPAFAAGLEALLGAAPRMRVRGA